MISPMPADSAQHMTCLEIWGGNQPFDNAVVVPGLDAWVYSKPYGQSDAGGDVYYVSSCATGRITRLLLADVSGHGAVVSETARALRSLMQRYVNFIDQTAFVRSMNTKFAEMSDAGTFATAIVSTFFAPTNELSLCIAGHPPPLHFRASDGTWSLLHDAAGNIPLGIDDISDWSQFTVRLGVGDLVVCYTDSLMESYDSNGEMLGAAGLLAIAQSLKVTDPQQAIPILLQAIVDRAAGNLSQDDVTVLLFRPNGTSKAAPFMQRAMAPLRVSWAVIKAAVTGKGPIPWPEFSLMNLGGPMFARMNRRKGDHGKPASG